jgi:D-psicose/D-tagatose/L-ribulose 3-epimerase
MTRPSLSISNLGWNATEDDEIADLLLNSGLSFIDLAMGRYFSSPSEVTVGEWVEVKNYWNKKGFQVVGMQSLLFGLRQANIFGSSEERQFLLGAFGRIFERAAAIGVLRLVFGSPSNRRRITFDEQEVAIAGEFFGKAGQLASRFGVIMLLEPNSTRYGCNFLNTAHEALDFVSTIESPGLGVNLDLGAQMDAGDSLEFSEQELRHLHHLHLSERDLGPLVDEQPLRNLLANQSLATNFNFATIEQLGSPKMSNVEAVRSSLDLATMVFGD